MTVTNLLSNALKYSPPESAVRLELTRLDEAVQIRAIDQGISIPGEDQARLFDVFYGASNVGSRTGTGLGLAIVKRAVEVHGGTVVVERARGVGTTITLPLPPGSRA